MIGRVRPWAQPDEPPGLGAKVDHVRIGNLSVAYRQAGSGPPVMMLHGGLSDSREWRGQLDGLADRFTLYAWDAPGCGASSDPDERTFRLPDYADALADLMDALDIRRAALVGLSFGSGLALQFYERHREMVSAMVLASPYLGWAGSLPADEVRRRLAQAERESRSPGDDLAQGWLSDLLTGTEPPEVAGELTEIIRSSHPSGYRTMARSFAEADLRSVLPTIRVPVLVVAAELDRRSPIEIARDLAATAPGARFALLPGVGHQSNMAAPEAFNAVVAAFLAPTTTDDP
jgi:pimeloyl-ACP methyl ester carboxylesterase